jgi:hypothetical protein
MGRTGSISNIRPDSFAMLRGGCLAAVCVGSLTATCAGSLVTDGLGFLEVTAVRLLVTAFTGLSDMLGADFCVITWTMSSPLF